MEHKRPYCGRIPGTAEPGAELDGSGFTEINQSDYTEAHHL